MVTDPVMLTTGIPILRVLKQDAVVDRALDLFKEALTKEVSRNYNNQSIAESTVPIVDDTLEQSDDEEESTLMAEVLKKRAASASVPQTTLNTQATLADKVNSIYTAWVTMTCDWESFLIHVQKLKSSEINPSKIKNGNCLYIAEKVDVLLWWKTNASMHFHVSRIAGASLAKPESNSLQERVFSCASLIDGKLRQRLGDVKFEMLCILSFNKSFMKTTADQGQRQLVSLIDSLGSKGAQESAAETLRTFYNVGDDVDGFTDNPQAFVDPIEELLQSTAAEVGGVPTNICGKRKRS